MLGGDQQVKYDAPCDAGAQMSPMIFVVMNSWSIMITSIIITKIVVLVINEPEYCTCGFSID